MNLAFSDDAHQLIFSQFWVSVTMSDFRRSNCRYLCSVTSLNRMRACMIEGI
jgi:hypothetical protein